MEFGSKSATIPICLNGKNYGLWEFILRCFIQGHELWGYIDDSEEKPKPNADNKVDETNLKKWTAKNSRVMSWILGLVEPHIGVNLRPHETAANMLTYLSTIYHHQNHARKYQLDLEIHEYS